MLLTVVGLTGALLTIPAGLGYFFFAGLRSFAGVFAGGRFPDWLLRRGRIRARVIVPAACLPALTPILAPALATTSVAVALPLLIFGAFLLGAPNPPLDAARLGIMPARLRGRAGAVRTALRAVLEAAAPLLFGYVSQYVSGGPGSSTSSGSGSGGAATGNPAGLLRAYPRDVATAAASAEAIGHAAGQDDRPGDRHAA